MDGYIVVEFRKDILIRFIDLGDVIIYFVFEDIGVINFIKESEMRRGFSI